MNVRWCVADDERYDGEARPTWSQAASGSGSSDKPAPEATVDATDVQSIAGRKTLKTHLARARVVVASINPTRVTSQPKPQQVSSSETARSELCITSGCIAGSESDAVIVPPLRCEPLNCGFVAAAQCCCFRRPPPLLHAELFCARNGHHWVVGGALYALAVESAHRAINRGRRRSRIEVSPMSGAHS